MQLTKLRWNIIAPVGLLAVVLLAIVWVDISTGGDAKPSPLIGAEGTPVRFVYAEPTQTPLGAPTATPLPGRPTSTPVAAEIKGTPAERDNQRRVDLIRLLGATTRLRDKDGKFPDTNNNVQSICIYKDRDALCKLDQFLGGPPPEDPLGAQNGYWYSGSPDGQSMKIFASLEEPTVVDPKCATVDEGIKKRPNVICVTVP